MREYPQDRGFSSERHLGNEGLYTVTVVTIRKNNSEVEEPKESRYSKIMNEIERKSGCFTLKEDSNIRKEKRTIVVYCLWVKFGQVHFFFYITKDFNFSNIPLYRNPY